jgi:transposase
MQVRTKRKYSSEFKVAAVQRSVESHHTVQSVADELGISPSLLSRWRVQMTRKATTPDATVDNQGPDKSYADLLRENARLKKQLARAEMEAEILKKAKAYFDKKPR